MYRDDDDGDLGLGLIGLGIGALIGIGTYAYSKYKENKEAKNASKQIAYTQTNKIYSPSDYDNLLDFSEDYIGVFHTLFCRFIPAFATYFSSMATIDISENTDCITEYEQIVISEWLKEKNEQTEYAGLFITETINQVNNLLKDQKERGGTIKFLKEQFCSIHDNYNDKELLNTVIIQYALMLTNRMVPAAFSYCFNVAQKWGMTKEAFINIAIEEGYNGSSISFPKLPVKPSDLADILDFNEDPFFTYYCDAQHLYYCRVVPALASCLWIISEIEFHSYNKEYLKILLDCGININTFSPAFINATIDAVYNKRDQIDSILYRIKDFLDKQENLRSIIPYFALLLGPKINIQYFNVFFQIFGYSTEEMNEICSDLVLYEGIDFNQVEEFKKYSKYYKGKFTESLEILGLSADATKDEIKHAYKVLSRKFHPDTILGKDLDEAFIQFASQKFREINEAYNYLMNNYL